MIRHGGKSLILAASLVVLHLASVSAVRASVDLSGVWHVDFAVNYPPPTGTSSFSCLVTIAQSGTNLDLSSADCSFSTLSGTIDSDSGDFSATIIQSLQIISVQGTGTASGFSGTLDYQPPPFLVSGTFVGQLCGNGQIDPGEACDDGNVVDGDCCDSTCQFEPSGSSCTDNNPCTDDMCDGAGTCTHQNHTGSCDDSNQCTSDDTCVNGACTGTAVPDGSACDDSNSCTDDSCQGGVCTSVATPAGTACPDDGNQCTDDLCDGAGACQHPFRTGACDTGNDCTDGACSGPSEQCVATSKPDGTTCDDHNACTMGDTCQSGMCQGGPASPNGTNCDDGDACTTNDRCFFGGCSGTPCGPCLACDVTLGCVPAIDSGCKHAGKSSIRLRATAGERLTWKWLHGDSTSQQDLEDPQSSANYVLCVYDGTVDQHGNPGLLLQAPAPAGSSWAPSGTGFTYKSSGQPDGITRIRLVPGQPSKAKILVNGSGSNLDLPPLQSITLPLTVELKPVAGLVCWQSSYGAATTETQRSFIAHSP
jgi:cysteine-rich repeat protein